MIEVVIDSIRVSLMSQHRLIVLKDLEQERYLPIWIGAFEAEAINTELQREFPPKSRPMTHDLLKATIEQMGGQIAHILINDLRDDVFYARLVIEMDDKMIEVDSRSSDAIAIAVRGNSPIYVADTVMEKAAILPDEDVEDYMDEHAFELEANGSDEDFDDEDEPEETKVDESQLSAFSDFLNSLDLDDLDDKE